MCGKDSKVWARNKACRQPAILPNRTHPRSTGENIICRGASQSPGFRSVSSHESLIRKENPRHELLAPYSPCLLRRLHLLSPVGHGRWAIRVCSARARSAHNYRLEVRLQRRSRQSRIHAGGPDGRIFRRSRLRLRARRAGSRGDNGRPPPATSPSCFPPGYPRATSM